MCLVDSLSCLGLVLANEPQMQGLWDWRSLENVTGPKFHSLTSTLEVVSRSQHQMLAPEQNVEYGHGDSHRGTCRSSTECSCGFVKCARMFASPSHVHPVEMMSEASTV